MQSEHISEVLMVYYFSITTWVFIKNFILPFFAIVFARISSYFATSAVVFVDGHETTTLKLDKPILKVAIEREESPFTASKRFLNSLYSIRIRCTYVPNNAWMLPTPCTSFLKHELNHRPILLIF